ncbi:unnamed protein product, partial [Aphanomyces euteiches]
MVKPHETTQESAAILPDTQLKAVDLVANSDDLNEQARLVTPSIDLTNVATTLPPEYKSIEGYRASTIRLLLEKIFHPFYLFQLISVALWLYEVYTTYALAVLFMSMGSVLYEVVTQATNTAQLEQLVACHVHVRRDGTTIVITSEDIIVGDIVLIEEQIVPADMVILTGECMADEASLTGEGEVWAVVTRTGFSTKKGELFRQILHPETPPFQIVSDSYRYLVALSIVAGLTSLLRIYDAIQAEKTLADLLISVFDLISTTIPAALPMILTVGVGFSLKRLRKERIFCIDAQKINIAGHLN